MRAFSRIALLLLLPVYVLQLLVNGSDPLLRGQTLVEGLAFWGVQASDFPSSLGSAVNALNEAQRQGRGRGLLVASSVREPPSPLAVELLDAMQARGLAPNAVTYNVLIGACDRGRQPEKAMELFEDMKRQGLKPDVITFGAMISVCEKGRLSDKAMEFFDKMQASGLTPDIITFNSLISAAARTGDLREAGRWLPRMRAACRRPGRSGR